jgi:hypothetical protein
MTSRKVLLCTIVIALFTVYSCKNKSASIMGTWITTAQFHNKGQEYKETYKFLTDSTFRLSYTVADSATGGELGYRFASSGRFRVNGDRIMLYKMISMADTVKGSDYVIMPRLKFIRADSMRNYAITVNPGDTSFYIAEQSCPPLVNCKGKFVYVKQLELDTTKRK